MTFKLNIPFNLFYLIQVLFKGIQRNHLVLGIQISDVPANPMNPDNLIHFY